MRETLFNWLTPRIAGARCLELYAGSGVLSMEALSRGASHVTLVEQDDETCRTIEANLAQLGADNGSYRCMHGTALDFVTANRDAFDIVFLDPPFSSPELDAVLPALAAGMLAEDALVYIETPTALDPASLPSGFTVIRHGRAGQVHYCLVARQR